MTTSRPPRLLFQGRLLTFIVLLIAGQALAEEPLNWYRMEFPPVFISTGEARNQGFGDVLLRMLIAKLPQYQHQLIDAPLERVLDQTSDGGELACANSLLRTPERENRMYFSNIYLTPPSNGVIIRASNRSRFEPFLDTGRLSLTRLLQTEKFTIGIQRSRSYGLPINAILAHHQGQPYLREKPGHGANFALLSDLSAQRGIDLVIAYPLETAYWLKTSRSPIPLHFLPVAEALDHEEWRAACSRTPQGKQAIATINEVLADPTFQQGFLRAYAAWQKQLADQLPGMNFSVNPQGVAQ